MERGLGLAIGDCGLQIGQEVEKPRVGRSRKGAKARRGGEDFDRIYKISRMEGEGEGLAGGKEGRFFDKITR